MSWNAESVYNPLRASLISLFCSSGAITLCFHMKIYRSININGRMPYGLGRKRLTTKIVDQAFKDTIFSAVLMCKAVLKSQNNQ